MSNDIAKALKQKTDAMLRLQGQSQKPVVYENVDGSYTAPEKSDYTAALAQGENIEILVSGNIKTIKAVIPQATEVKFGGIKAKERTTETSEAAIDLETGKLFVPAAGVASNGLPVGGVIGQIPVKVDGTDYNVGWMDPPDGGSMLPDFVGNKKKVLTVNEAEDGVIFSQPLMAYFANGMAVEDFESEQYKHSFVQVGWSKVSGLSYNGSTAFTNGSSGNNARYVEFDLYFPISGVLSFMLRSYSTMTNHADRRSKVYVDGVLKIDVTTQAWTKYEYSLSAGLHKLKFAVYSFSASYNIQTWIDDITIPAGGVYNMQAVANNPNSLLLTSADGSSVGFMPKSTFMLKLSGAVLPTATVDYRGQIFTVLGGAAVADVAYICMKNSTEGYEWRPI